MLRKPSTGELTADQLDCLNLLAEIFGGIHNMHGEIWHADTGISYVFPGNHNLATWDMNRLTRAVFLAHDRCIRLQIDPASSGYLRIYAHKRQRAGGMTQRHPTLEQAIETHRRFWPAPEEA